jgi:phosphoenolpyruvate phosphomutase
MASLSPAAQLRALWAVGNVVRAAGAHDVLGARLAVRAGVEAIWASGFELSTAHGVPDASILTMSDLLDAAQSIAHGIAPVPVIADCDTGFGSSANVIRMVQLFEAAGIAAVCLEDKQYPKLNSFVAGRQELASVTEFVGKLLAAKNAQRDPDFVIIARTEALIAGGSVDEAIRRGQAYVRAGADALLIHDKSPTGSGVREVLARWRPPVPVIVVPTTYPAFGVAECQAHGISTVIWANHGIRAATQAIGDVWAHIVRDGHTAAVEANIAPLGALFELQGMPAHTAAEHAYARGGMVPTRAVLLHAGTHADDPTLAPLTAHTPLASLDINGASLLERQCAVLRQCGVTDITVVVGPHAESVPGTGARVVRNAEWASTGEMGSLRCAGSADRRTLICYGDVIVQPELVRRLLQRDEPAVLIVDRTPSPDARDPVRLPTECEGGRFLSPETPTRVEAIGPAVERPNGEFAGMALLDVEQFARLMAEAEPQQSLPHALAALSLVALEVTSGWLELRSFAHYQDACRQVAR